MSVQASAQDHILDAGVGMQSQAEYRSQIRASQAAKSSEPIIKKKEAMKRSSISLLTPFKSVSFKT